MAIHLARAYDACRSRFRRPLSGQAVDGGRRAARRIAVVRSPRAAGDGRPGGSELPRRARLRCVHRVHRLGRTQKGQILFAYSSDCGATWSRPRDLSTIADPDVTDDGIVNNADLNLIKASFGKQCGDEGFNPQRTPTATASSMSSTSPSSRAAWAGRFRRPPPDSPGGEHCDRSADRRVVRLLARVQDRDATDAIQVVKSTDFGVTFTAPAPSPHSSRSIKRIANDLSDERISHDDRRRPPRLRRVGGARIRAAARAIPSTATRAS
jgi:hypothetical protein